MLLKRTKNAAFEVIFSKVAFSQLFTVKPYIFAKRNPPQLYQSQGGLMAKDTQVNTMNHFHLVNQVYHAANLHLLKTVGVFLYIGTMRTERTKPLDI